MTTTTNEHTELAELIRELRAEANRPSPHGSATIVCALMKKAAAMLEAQRPALKPLTDRQIQDAVRDAHIAFCLDKYATFEVALIRKAETAHDIKEQA